MNAPTGSLAITARRSGERTVLERVRYEGISRCSRAFPDGDAARIVLSQLGPGVVRGDSVVTNGRLRANAHLIVTSQTATRLMGGSRASVARANWTAEEGSLLELIGEPLVADAGASYETSTEIELGAGARVLVSEIASVPRQAHVRVRVCVRRLGSELYYDALDANSAPGVTGSFVLIGVEPTEIDGLVAALDAVADVRRDVNLGVGALANGVFARLIAPDAWTAGATLHDLRDAVRAARGVASAKRSGSLRTEGR